MKTFLRCCWVASAALTLLLACPFDDTLREYLDAHFWLPFSKSPQNFAKRNVRRLSAPYAGMVKAKGDAPLEKLRAQYQKISQPDAVPADLDTLRKALADARAVPSLSLREREEVDLIDAKIDMREGDLAEPEPLLSAKTKLERFLKAARTAAFQSEARGWLAHIDYLLGDRTAAGKIYLDELNRGNSNLSRETVLNSLQMNYGYDGGAQLLVHLEEYFDTPEHAAFAIELVTNPHWDRDYLRYGRTPPPADRARAAYPRIRKLLEKHSDLLKHQSGAESLALLGMRTALRMGDPPAALKIAEMVPEDSAVRAGQISIGCWRRLISYRTSIQRPSSRFWRSSNRQVRRKARNPRLLTAYVAYTVRSTTKFSKSVTHCGFARMATRSMLPRISRTSPSTGQPPAGISICCLTPKRPSRTCKRSLTNTRTCLVSVLCSTRWQSGSHARTAAMRRGKCTGRSMLCGARRECIN